MELITLFEGIEERNERLAEPVGYFEQSADKEARWLEKRIKKITSSVLPNLVKRGQGNLNPWGKVAITAMLSVADEMISGVARPSIKGVKALEFGKMYETEALEYYNKKTGKNAKSCSNDFDEILFFEPMAGFGDSPDAIVEPDGRIEIKCPENGAVHLGYTTIKAFSQTDDYYWQLLGHLIDDKAQYCDFVSYNPRYPDGHPLKMHIVTLHKKDHLFNINYLKSRITTAVEYITKAVQKNDMNLILNINNYE